MTAPETPPVQKAVSAKTVVSVMAASILYVGGGLWLLGNAVWPGTCDRSGHRGIGFVKQLYCSPDLLDGGTTEKLLFAWLWLIPIAILAPSIYGLTTRRRAP